MLGDPEKLPKRPRTDAPGRQLPEDPGGEDAKGLYLMSAKKKQNEDGGRLAEIREADTLKHCR